MEENNNIIKKEVQDDPCILRRIEPDGDVHIGFEVDDHNETIESREKNESLDHVEKRKISTTTAASQTENDGNVIAAGIQMIVS